MPCVSPRKFTMAILWYEERLGMLLKYRYLPHTATAFVYVVLRHGMDKSWVVLFQRVSSMKQKSLGIGHWVFGDGSYRSALFVYVLRRRRFA